MELEKLKEDNEEILVDYFNEKYGGNYDEDKVEDALDRWLSNLDEDQVKEIIRQTECTHNMNIPECLDCNPVCFICANTGHIQDNCPLKTSHENWREELVQVLLKLDWYHQGKPRSQIEDFISNLLDKKLEEQKGEIVKWLNNNDYLEDEDCNHIINNLK